MINHRKNLLYMLSCLTLLLIGAQLALFFIHYKVSVLIDSLVNSSISLSMFHLGIWLPIIIFIVLQLLAYVIFVAWIWFIATSVSEWFRLSRDATYGLGIFFWVVGVTALFSLNAHYYPNSFFAAAFCQNKMLNSVWLVLLGLWLIATVFAYLNFFWNKRYRGLGMFFLIIMISVSAHHDEKNFVTASPRTAQKYPDIIFIGIDSLRPDFVAFFNKRNIHTPELDHLLQGAAVFTRAYTPLGRTFPAWVSILTAKYPKHNHARINIADPAPILQNDNLPKRLKAAGYETIYGTDEPRFTDINEAYGFDYILGPKSGIVEFILGGLSDFPLTNLLINLPFGRVLFPYNYANRGADITYQPDTFLHLVKAALAGPHHKPVFLSLHLCLAHWPYTWADGYFAENISTPDRYAKAVERVDGQLGNLFKILKAAGLLEHSVVVIFSDHGGALGMLGDRVIDKKFYIGDSKKLKQIKITKLSGTSQYSLDFEHDYSINTSFGAGTEVLSLTQHEVLLLFKRYGMEEKKPQRINQVASLLDISPTILDLVGLQPLQNIDGMSLKPFLVGTNQYPAIKRPVFFETGDMLADLESDQILVEKIVNQTIGSYLIDPDRGQLVINPMAEKTILKTKQRAVLLGDWLLALYPNYKTWALVPKNNKNKELYLKAKTVPGFYVLVNLKTNNWTMDLSCPFAKTAPLSQLLKELKTFYGDEI